LPIGIQRAFKASAVQDRMMPLHIFVLLLTTFLPAATFA
jgi:hypothetical protein